MKRWALKHPDQVDYLLMRSEDLLDSKTRLDCIQKLREFLGGPASDDKICCLVKKVTDFGKSATHIEGGKAKKKLLAAAFKKPGLRRSASVSGTKRRLTDEQLPKVVPQQLLHDYKLWKGQVMKIANEKNTTVPYQILSALAETGNSLAQRLQMNKEGLEGHVELQEIDVLRNMLTTIKSHARIESKVSDHVEVGKRYGKWQKFLSDKPKLSEALHEHGKEGLIQFGYEPRQYFDYTVGNGNRTDICQDTNIDECPAIMSK